MNSFIRKIVFVVLCVVIGLALYKTFLSAINYAGSSQETVPATFGRTHFIVGMSPDDTHALQQNSSEDQSCDDDISANNGSCRQAFFSPDDGLEKKIIDCIDREQVSMKIAVFQFTNMEIARAIKRAQLRGVSIEVITDPLCLQDKFNKITWLAKEGIKTYVYNPDAGKATLSNKMHHKFIVFGKNIENKKLLWVGSFNFTKSADIANQESVVLLDDSHIINKFNRQYARVKERSMLLEDFSKNHVVVQAWQPSASEEKPRQSKKVSVAHAKRSRMPKHNEFTISVAV